jgi:hypothetical protein
MIHYPRACRLHRNAASSALSDGLGEADVPLLRDLDGDGDGLGETLGVADGPVGVGIGGVRQAQSVVPGSALRSGLARCVGDGRTRGGAVVATAAAAGEVLAGAGSAAAARLAERVPPRPAVEVAAGASADNGYGWASAVDGFSDSSDPSPFTTAK